LKSNHIHFCGIILNSKFNSNATHYRWRS